MCVQGGQLDAELPVTAPAGEFINVVNRSFCMVPDQGPKAPQTCCHAVLMCAIMNFGMFCGIHFNWCEVLLGSAHATGNISGAAGIQDADEAAVRAVT